MATDPKLRPARPRSGYTLVARRGSPVGAQIDPALVDDLRAIVKREPESDVQQLLGVSADTWNRIKRGSTVRPTTADRLILRIQAFGGAC